MPAKKQGAKAITRRVDIAPLLKRASIRVDHELRAHFAQTRRLVDQMARVRNQLDDAMKDLQSQNRLGNFEIQRLMSAFNQAETLASNIQKKADDTANAIISRIG
jgi:uncharacterized membrane-anchored protein YhcB (DUF1043 family)